MCEMKFYHNFHHNYVDIDEQTGIAAWNGALSEMASIPDESFHFKKKSFQYIDMGMWIYMEPC